LGTYGYVAPEQVEDARAVDHRADIYGLGCTLYFLLTGTPVYSGESATEQLSPGGAVRPRSIRDKRPEVSEALDNVFLKMVAELPDDRYQSMSEVIIALDGCPEIAPFGHEAAASLAETAMFRAGANRAGTSADESTLTSAHDRSKSPSSDALSVTAAAHPGRQATKRPPCEPSPSEDDRRRKRYFLFGGAIAVAAGLITLLAGGFGVLSLTSSDVVVVEDPQETVEVPTRKNVNVTEEGKDSTSVAPAQPRPDPTTFQPTFPEPLVEEKKELTYELLLNEVNGINCGTGNPGPVIPSGDLVPVATGDDDAYWQVMPGERRQPAVFAVAGPFGAGRVIAVGHEGFVSTESLQQYDNERFARNVIAWLSKSTPGPICVRLTGYSMHHERFVSRLTQEDDRYEIQKVNRGADLSLTDLENCRVLVYAHRSNPTSEAEIDAIESFVRDGGGAWFTGLGWGFMQQSKKDLEQYPMNQIGKRFGFRFENGTLWDPTDCSGGQKACPIFRRFRVTD
jgi:hypothetical protein